MYEEYKSLYEHGPIKVGLVLGRTQTGSHHGDSKNLQLEGILSGETNTNLIFDELNSISVDANYIKKIEGSKALVRKEYVAVIYQIKKD